MIARTIFVATLLLCTQTLMAATITVRKDGLGDYSVIQDALDVAADGDTISIGPGEFTDSIMVWNPTAFVEWECFAYLRSDNLTIVGAGTDETLIGPSITRTSADTSLSGGLYYKVNGGSLRISDLTFRNCYGSAMIYGDLIMERCRHNNNETGIYWSPGLVGGAIRDCRFDLDATINDAEAFCIDDLGMGGAVAIERCQFDIPGRVYDLQNFCVSDCTMHGIGLYGHTHAVLLRCESLGGNVAVAQSIGSNGICEIYDCDLSGETAALTTSDSAPGARYFVANSHLTGGSYGIFWFARLTGPCEVHNCDLIKGTGPVVRCDAYGPVVTHDMRNNYWGTTDEAMIRSWIIDRYDVGMCNATVLYSPFAGQSVPTEATSWGDLKAMFR